MLRTYRTTEIIAARKQNTPAFSLVEVVIVVTIIGILNAIAVPRISSAATSANDTKVKADVEALRNAIDLYAAEHNVYFPGQRKSSGGNGAGTASDFMAQLTQYSDINGKTGKLSPNASPPAFWAGTCAGFRV